MLVLQAMIRPVRRIALFIGLLSIAMAILRANATRHFIATSRHTTGQVLASPQDGARATVRFRAEDGTLQHFEVPAAPDTSLGQTVPVMYLQAPTGIISRLATSRVLWAPMWSWIESAVAAMLVAIYARALVEDPLSVIGFKSWRATRSG